MTRGAIKTKTSQMVTLWLPKELVAPLEAAVRDEDSDKSKFIRAAVRNKLNAMGYRVSASELNR